MSLVQVMRKEGIISKRYKFVEVVINGKDMGIYALDEHYDKTMLEYDVAPFVTVVMGDDIDHCRMPIKGNMALYIGGMGARDKNFYNDYAKALGYEEAAAKIQDLFLAGKKDEAMAAVPDELVDACHLVGPAERIKERLQSWKQASAEGKIGSMLLGAGQIEALELVAGEML